MQVPAAVLLLIRSFIRRWRRSAFDSQRVDSSLHFAFSFLVVIFFIFGACQVFIEHQELLTNNSPLKFLLLVQLSSPSFHKCKWAK